MICVVLSSKPKTAPAGTKVRIGSVVALMHMPHLAGLDLSWVGHLRASLVALGQQHEELQLPRPITTSHSVDKAPNLHFLPGLAGRDSPAEIIRCYDLNMLLHPRIMLKGFGSEALA